MSSILEDSGDKLVTLTGTVGLGIGIQKQWVECKAKFLDYVSSRFGQSAKVSLDTGELIIAEVDKKYLQKFKTKEETEAYVKRLEYWE